METIPSYRYKTSRFPITLQRSHSIEEIGRFAINGNMTDRIRPPPIEISIFHFAWTRSKIFQSRTSNSFPFRPRSCLRSGGKEARDLSSANYTVGRSATKCKLFIAFVNVVRRIRAVFALSRARTPSSTLPRSRQIHLFARL